MNKRLISSVALATVLAAGAWAQNVISARAGFVNYKHGDVVLPKGADGKALRQIEQGQLFATRHGRLELLLTPGSFLRLDHESEARLVSSRLPDVKVELLSGTATIEVNEVIKGSSLALAWRDQIVPITRTGLYRFEAGPESMRVYVEKGKLQLAGMKGAVKSNKYVDVAPSGTLSAALKYNGKDLDDFDRWNRGRGEQLAVASFAAANAFLRRSYSMRSSVWMLDPYFGFATYLPYSNSVRSPYGFTYHCPRTIYQQPGGGDHRRGGGTFAGGGAGGGAGRGAGVGAGGAEGAGGAGGSGAGSGGRTGGAGGGSTPSIYPRVPRDSEGRTGKSGRIEPIAH